MKKIFFVTIITLLLFSASSVFAAEVEYTDMSQDVIVVSGAASKGSTVSLLILHEGFQASDITASDEAQEYFGTTICHEDTYTFEIKLLPKDASKKETFTFVINNGAGVTSFLWEYYPMEMKKQMITTLNENTIEAAQFQEALAVYGLTGYPLAQEDNFARCAEALTAIQKKAAFKIDVNAMYTLLKQALLVGAYADGDTELLLANQGILYTDVLGIDGSEEYQDYLKELSPEGRSKLNHTLLSGSYEGTEDIAKKFNELLFYHVIMDYKSGGYGHVGTYLDKYESMYRKAGFDLASLGTNNSDIYLALVSYGANNLSELKDVFNDLVSQEESSSGGGSSFGGGGGGGGAFGGSAVSPGTASSTLTEGQGYVEEQSSSILSGFADLETVTWAQDAITELYQRGIINGKSNGVFAPNDKVTRAEFVKMIVLGFDLKGQGETTFTDVSAHWAEEYILSAAAAGVISGYADGRFGTDDLILREQGAAILYRMLSKGSYALSEKDYRFADETEISDYALLAVKTLAASDILHGKDSDRFAPAEDLTRAEAAVLIYNVIGFMEGDE